MAITDILNLTPDVVAEQNPELHQMRQIAFGQDYLSDIEQGTGTAQYYTGWGNVPSDLASARQAITADTDAYVAPATTGTTTNIGVGGGPDAGLMSVAPTDVGSMPTLPAGGMEGGVWGPQDYLQDTGITRDPMTGDARLAEAIAAQDRQDAFNQQFAFEDKKTAHLRPTAPDVILPEARSDDLLPEGFDYTTALLDNWALGDEVQPETILPEAKPDIYTDRIMDPNLMRIEQERAVQDASYPIAGLSMDQKQLYNQLGVSDIIDPSNPNKDKYGKNIITGADTLGVLGNTYEEGVREYVEKYGDKEYTTPSAIQKQKDYKALVDAWDERDADKIGARDIAIALGIEAADEEPSPVSAPVSIPVPAFISGQDAGGGGLGSQGGPPGGEGGWKGARGGLIRKQYGSGGIVDLI